jgi:hypothetical protein
MTTAMLKNYSAINLNLDFYSVSQNVSRNNEVGMRNDSIADFGLRILDCTRWIESILDCGMEEQSAKGIAQSVKIPLHLPTAFHLLAMPYAPCAFAVSRAPRAFLIYLPPYTFNLI